MIEWKGQRVIVTGGAGFIGSHLVDALLERGAEVVVIDDLSRGHIENLVGWHERLTLYRANLRTFSPPLKPSDVVFHLAARVTNIQANRHDHLGMLQDNVILNWQMAEAVRRAAPLLYVPVSTVCVYPHDAPVPTPESAGWPMAPEPTNEGYGLAKGIQEKQGAYLCQELGIPVLVPRFSNAIGERDYYDTASSHVVPALIRRVMEGESPLRVWGSGEQTRVFVDAADIAEALVRLAETPAAHDGQPVNIGHGREISIRRLVHEVLAACEVAGRKVEFDTSKPDGHKRRAVDTSRLRSLIDWEPPTLLEETLAKMVGEYRAGRSWL